MTVLVKKKRKNGSLFAANGGEESSEERVKIINNEMWHHTYFSLHCSNTRNIYYHKKALNTSKQQRKTSQDHETIP